MSDSFAQRLDVALADRYEIQRELGEGGMATVYLAKDLKHNRDVALKVLKPELAAVVGAERFLAEIETTANLQHPNILALYDSGEAEGFLYYVMPHVEGESLRDRLDAENQLSVDEAVKIAIAVANALDFAHARGVVHRDIKPGNILFQGGQPVVADFGIALAVGAGSGSRLTETGLSVGTPYYMSPEQATGDRQVGARSDIYSLGCVLYEMLVGDPPYMGSTAQAVLGQIITGKPVDTIEKRSAVPLHVDAAIRRALEKVPADRFKTAAEMAAALDDPGFRHGGAREAGTVASEGPWKAFAFVLGAVALVLGVLLFTPFGQRGSDATSRYVLQPPLGSGQRAQPYISPDGSLFAFAVREPGVPLTRRPGAEESQIWIQERDQLDPRRLPGTEGAVYLDFSPDGQRLAFVTSEGLETIAVDDGDPITISEDGPFGSVTWTAGYLWVTSLASGWPALRFPENGGDPERVPLPEELPWIPMMEVLPGGRGAVVVQFGASTDFSDTRVLLLDFESVTSEVLGTGVVGAYAPSGHLLYATPEGVLMGAPFEVESLRVTGDFVPILAERALALSLSDTGDMLLWRGAKPTIVPQVAWIDRNGNVESIRDFAPETMPDDPTLSPDGTAIALSLRRNDTTRVMVGSVEGGPLVPVSDGGTLQDRPAWSADGRRIGFRSDRMDGELRLWQQRADGSGRASPLTGPEALGELDVGPWAPDQTTIVAGGPQGLNGITPAADSTLSLLLEDARYDNPTLSPDGRWVAYSAEVSGESRVFVRPFPNVDDARYPVSEGVGYDAQWPPDGREIFYVRPGFEGAGGSQQLYAVRVSTEPSFRAESPTLVATLLEGISGRRDGWMYDVHPSGDRFAAVRFRFEVSEVVDVVLVENVFAEIERALRRGERR